VQEPAADGKHQPAAEHPPAGAADAKLRPLSFDDLLTTYYAPLTDHHRGRLYEAATALLNAVRELPKAIDLGVALPAAEAQPGPEDAAGTGEDTAAPLGFSQAAERGKWLAVLDHPVVAEEDVAYALFLAGSFKDAAAAYRKLREGHADDRHYLIMLLLSESNAGNAAEARNLLAELAKKGDEPAKWAAWMTEMMKLRAEQSKAKESK
jgi:tetratricopeptide (TPR) repeat protein